MSIGVINNVDFKLIKIGLASRMNMRITVYYRNVATEYYFVVQTVHIEIMRLVTQERNLHAEVTTPFK